jgi:uncharacterized iron-regulated membrane protein
MQGRFHSPIGVLIGALLWQDMHHLLPVACGPWIAVSAKIGFTIGLVWFGIKALDWWGEEAPVFHPYRAGKLVWLSYRDAEARQRLIKKLNGDARMARRQVRILMARYPGQTDQWYWEQAIVDLERDQAS